MVSISLILIFSYDFVEIQPCNPNPCQNMAECSVADFNTPSCTCINSNFKGDFCEQEKTLVETPPLLMRNTQSDPIQIKAKSSSPLDIIIKTDPSVRVIPSNSITIIPPASSASFMLRAQLEGVFELDFTISTVDNLLPPDKQVVVVTNPGSGGRGYYSELNATGGLSPGCCQFIPVLSDADCPIRLSSSCGWSSEPDETKTSGVVYMHSNTVLLPLSLAGIKLPSGYKSISKINIGEYKCSQCSSSSDEGYCFDYSPTIGDISMLLEEAALFDDFLYRISSILPSSVKMNILPQRSTLHSRDTNAILVKGKDIGLFEGCEDIDARNMDFYHVFKTHHDLQYSIFNEQSFYKPQNESSPLCFVTSVCKVGEMHIGLPSDASTNVLELDFFKKYMDNDWEVKFKALSLYKYGKTYKLDDELWNGQTFFIALKHFNIKSELQASGNFTGTHLSSRVMFEGQVYSGEDNRCVRLILLVLVYFHYSVMSLNFLGKHIKWQNHIINKFSNRGNSIRPFLAVNKWICERYEKLRIISLSLLMVYMKNISLFYGYETVFFVHF